MIGINHCAAGRANASDRKIHAGHAISRNWQGLVIDEWLAKIRRCWLAGVVSPLDSLSHRLHKRFTHQLLLLPLALAAEQAAAVLADLRLLTTPSPPAVVEPLYTAATKH